MRRDIIKSPQSLKTSQIYQLQLDPYGVCNAKCWFCPVAYNGNPKEGKEVMSPDLLDKILKNIIDERDKNGLVNKSFNAFYTAHYNEILLYPYFEELLQICKKYNLKFVLLSNGIPLTNDKVDLIKKYGVVSKILLNIPAFDAETWSKRTGVNIKQFNQLVDNINYAKNELFGLVRNKLFSIQINGFNENSYSWITKGVNFPKDLTDNELPTQITNAKVLFPNIDIVVDSNLIDRSGLLNDIFTNKPSIIEKLQKGDESKKVIGCNIGIEIGGRSIGWLHVNGAGDAFLCCNDFHFDYKFGNFKTQELKDFWGSDEHINKVINAYDTICKNCSAAIFE